MKNLRRALSAISKLWLFQSGELQMTEEQFDVAMDDIVSVLEDANNEKHRLLKTSPAPEES